MNAFELVFGARPDRSPLIDRAPRGARWGCVRPRAEEIVRAWAADHDQKIPHRGGVLRARAGRDVIVEHDTGEHAVVRRDIFERVYEPAEDGRFRKRRDIVYRYFTVDRPVRVKTLEGPQGAEPGDWIMEGVDGELWPIKRDKALQKYEQA